MQMLVRSKGLPLSKQKIEIFQWRNIILLPHILVNHNDCIRAAFAIDNDGQKGRAGPADQQSQMSQKCSAASMPEPEENQFM